MVGLAALAVRIYLCWWHVDIDRPVPNLAHVALSTDTHPYHLTIGTGNM